MRSWKGMAVALGVTASLSACVATPGSLSGSWGAPSFASLQQMCGTQTVDYGDDSQSVYITLFDAYVANRHGRLPKDAFCAFQNGIAQQYASTGASSDPQKRGQWAMFFNEQRAKALSWRAAVDPTLRAG